MAKQTSSLPRRWRNDQGSFLRKTTYAELPHKFEAGTPNIAAGIVLGTAVDYMNEVGFDNIQLQELELLEYGTKH
jgi:cysteine desulfurase/selenocysteine lyase